MDNTTLPGTGDVVRDIDRAGVKTQVVALDIGGAAYESLVTPTNPIPVVILAPTPTLPVQDSDGNGILGRILQMLLSPLGYDKSLQRQRGTVVVETLPTLANVTTCATVTTVATVTNQTNIGGFNADVPVRAQVNAAWALNVRARIT
jgi:hypothetical protein